MICNQRAALHRNARAALSGRPVTPIQVGAVHQLARWPAQHQHLTAIAERAGVNLVGGNIGHTIIIAALQEVESARGNAAPQGDVQLARLGHQVPTRKINGFPAGIMKLNPLIVSAGCGTTPGHLADKDRSFDDPVCLRLEIIADNHGWGAGWAQ